MTPDLPQVYYPTRRGAVLLFLGSAAFVAAGIWIVIEGDWKGYLCVGFFGLCALVGVIQLLPGSSFLKLTPEGIEYASLYRRHFIEWSSITEFGVVSIKQTGLTVNRMVGFNLDSDVKARGRNLSKALSGFEAALPDCYGHKAADLANLLTALHAQHRNTTKANKTELLTPARS